MKTTVSMTRKTADFLIGTINRFVQVLSQQPDGFVPGTMLRGFGRDEALSVRNAPVPNSIVLPRFRRAARVLGRLTLQAHIAKLDLRDLDADDIGAIIWMAANTRSVFGSQVKALNRIAAETKKFSEIHPLVRLAGTV